MIKRIIQRWLLRVIDFCLSFPCYDEEDRAQYRDLISAYRKIKASMQ